MNTFLTPEELWKEFDISGPLEETTLHTDQFGEYEYQQVTFAGQRLSGGVCRIFGVFAYPTNAKGKLPCVLLVHDRGGKIDFSYIDYFLNLGVAVLMCDYSGKRDGERHTIFPPSHEHLNNAKNQPDDISLPLADTRWINTTLIFRHALKFIRTRNNINLKKIGVVSLGLGSITGFHLALCEPDLAMCCNFHYGGWRNFEEMSKEMDAHTAKYLLGVAPQIYSPLAKVPLFLLGSTNTDMCDSDRCFDTMARASGVVPNFLYLSPNYISTVDWRATRNLRLLLNQYLLDAHITIPSSPELSFTIEDGEVFLECQTEPQDKVYSIEVHFAQGENTPHLRAYQKTTLVHAGEGRYVGTLDGSSSLATYAFCNVKFICGYAISSNLLKIPPFGDSLKKKTLLSDGTNGGFFPLGTLSNPNANQFFTKSNVVASVGAYDLKGIGAPRLATFAIGEATLETADKSMSLQIYSALPQQVRLVLMASQNSDLSFSVTIDLVGGELWQKVILDPSDFVGADMQSPTDFQYAKLMFFNSEYDFLISNISFV